MASVSSREMELSLEVHWISFPPLTTPCGIRGKPVNILYDYTHSGEEPSCIHNDQSGSPLTEPSMSPTKRPSPLDPPNEAILEESIKEGWSNEARYLSKAIWISSPSMIIPCSMTGIPVDAHLSLIMEVNIMPWHLEYSLLGNVQLRPSDKLLKSCAFGHILNCRGVASVVPLMLDKI